MKNLNWRWKEFKEKVYYWDGSWRDIYIQKIEEGDWKKCINYVNQNYVISWYNGKTELEENQISYDVIDGYLKEEHDRCSSAKIFIDNIQINCHFFSKSEIENDIDPREISSIEDHKKIIKYMTDLSCILEKEVILTPEAEPEIILINVKECL